MPFFHNERTLEFRRVGIEWFDLFFGRSHLGWRGIESFIYLATINHL